MIIKFADDITGIAVAPRSRNEFNCTIIWEIGSPALFPAV
jgi:hypothetical protein